MAVNNFPHLRELLHTAPSSTENLPMKHIFFIIFPHKFTKIEVSIKRKCEELEILKADETSKIILIVCRESAMEHAK